MIRTTIFPGRYIQGENALARLGRLAKTFGRKALVICGGYAMDRLAPGLRPDLEKEVAAVFVRFGGECSDPEIARLTAEAKTAGADVVIGIGGGKTLDTAKAVAHECRAPVIVVPTIASTDAPCSALSVIYTPEGEFARCIFFPKNPDVVLVDTGVIAAAPPRFLVSGMGDALATFFEAESCRVGCRANTTGDQGSMTAYALASLCFETLMEFGVLAKQACEAGVVTPALDRVIETNTLLSGLGFESGGLAAAHAIHNGLTVLKPTRAYYHGEKVAFGTLASLLMTDKPRRVIEQVFGFCEAVGLPTTLSDIGLAGASDADLLAVAEKSCAPEETLHNEIGTVTPARVLAALKAADRFGREHRRKQ